MVHRADHVAHLDQFIDHLLGDVFGEIPSIHSRLGENPRLLVLLFRDFPALMLNQDHPAVEFRQVIFGDIHFGNIEKDLWFQFLHREVEHIAPTLDEVLLSVNVIVMLVRLYVHHDRSIVLKIIVENIARLRHIVNLLDVRVLEEYFGATCYDVEGSFRELLANCSDDRGRLNVPTNSAVNNQ